MHHYQARRAIAKGLETAAAEEKLAQKLRAAGSEQAARRAEARAEKARSRAERAIESLGIDPRD